MDKDNTKIIRTQEEIDAQIGVYLSEKARNEAEAKRHLAETKQRGLEAEKVSLELAKLKRAEATELARDQYHHVYVFDEAVGSGSVETCIHKLAEWNRNEPGCDIEIIFNSPGGSIVDGLGLFDYITRVKNDGHKITTSALGMAASMAGVLLQAGNVRKMAPQSFLLIHEGSLGAIGNFGEVEDRVEFMKKLHDRILDIFATRSTISRKKIETNWKRKDWWLNAEEALELGLIDVIG